MDQIWEGPNIKQNNNRYQAYYNLQISKNQIPVEFKEIRLNLPSNSFKCYRLKSDNDLYLFTWIRELSQEDMKFYKNGQIDLIVTTKWLHDYASNLGRGIIWEDKKKQEDSWKKWYQSHQNKIRSTDSLKEQFLNQALQRDLKYKDKLLAFQVEHTQKILQSLIDNGRAIDASDTGTGKTYVALAICRELGLTPVILCPLSVIPSWEQALEYFGWNPKRKIRKGYYLSNYEQYRAGNMPFLKQMNPKNEEHEKWFEEQEGVKEKPKYSYKWTLDPDKHLVIFDECHKVKNTNTYNYSIFWWAIQHKIKILALSATMADKLINVYPMAYMLGLCRDMTDFKSKYMKNIDLSYFGKEIDEEGIMRFNVKYKDDLSYFRESDYNLHNLHRDIFPMKGSRMVINDLGDMFPDNLIEAQTYKMTTSEEIQDTYDQLQINIIKNKFISQKNKYNNLLLEDVIPREQLLRTERELDVLQSKYRKLTGRTIEFYDPVDNEDDHVESRSMCGFGNGIDILRDIISARQKIEGLKIDTFF